MPAGGARAGGLIVFTSTRDGGESLYAVHPDGRHLTRLVANARSPRISPDGRAVVFVASSSFVPRLLDVASGKVRPLSGGLALGFGWADTRWPWAPGGDHFAVGADDGLRLFGVAGARGARLTRRADDDPAWSPDGKSVAFADETGGIWVVGADGAGLRQLVENGSGPQWSPDGREISFTRVLGVSVVTAVVSARGGTPRKIAVGFSAWSPDSRTLAIANDAGGLRLYSRTGVLQRTLLAGKGAEDPTWAPDGQRVLAVVDGDLWLFGRRGGATTRLTQGARYGYVNSEPSWSVTVPPKVAGTPAAASIPFGGPLVAVSRTTGRLIARFPRVSGRASTNPGTAAIYAVVDDGRGGWYVGGDFVSAAGVACPNLVHVTAAESVDRSWCPRPNGPIRGLARIGTTLFVGGERLTQIAGQGRRGLAAFETTSGQLTGWNPAVGGDVYGLALDPTGTTVFFDGLFDSVGGITRTNFAAVDARTGRPTNFAPNPDTNAHGDSVSAFAATPSHVYAWGYYSRIGGEAVPVVGATAQLDAASGKLLAWTPQVSGGPYSTALVGDRVILGGVIGQLGGKRRDDLGSFNGETAAADDWGPATGATQIAEELASYGGLIFVALAHDHWAAGPRELVAYNATNGRRTWQAHAILKGGAVNAIAASDTTVVVGGYFQSAR